MRRDWYRHWATVLFGAATVGAMVLATLSIIGAISDDPGHATPSRSPSVAPTDAPVGGAGAGWDP
ncbi:MAG TPA: hypothetical protein VJT31_12825 [Rugosimonospora sp.]|nr:hypothetical protein [Rugosimonospora sp.]